MFCLGFVRGGRFHSLQVMRVMPRPPRPELYMPNPSQLLPNMTQRHLSDIVATPRPKTSSPPLPSFVWPGALLGTSSPVFAFASYDSFKSSAVLTWPFMVFWGSCGLQLMGNLLMFIGSFLHKRSSLCFCDFPGASSWVCISYRV